jgi:hypothetical protein
VVGRVTLFQHTIIDLAAKRHKKHKNKISYLIISINYEEKA